MPREMPLAFLRDLHLTLRQSNIAIPRLTSLASTTGQPSLLTRPNRTLVNRTKAQDTLEQEPLDTLVLLVTNHLRSQATARQPVAHSVVRTNKVSSCPLRIQGTLLDRLR